MKRKGQCKFSRRPRRQGGFSDTLAKARGDVLAVLGRGFRYAALALIAALLIDIGYVTSSSTSRAIAAPRDAAGWTNYRDADHGFFIAYPDNVFRPDDRDNVRGARSFVSLDGRARLLVGAFVNETRSSLRQYRAYVLEESYAGADIDYAPIRKRFFVLSGTRNGMIFYERVDFTCGGDIINSWAMVYPEDEKDFYDRTVEAIAKTYRPGSRACR